LRAGQGRTEKFAGTFADRCPWRLDWLWCAQQVVSGDEEFMTDSSVAAPTNDVGGIAADRLRSFVERLERLEEEKKGISDDIKDVYLEAKGTGFDVKIIRTIIRLRKKAKEERQEEEELIELYKMALGME
jgi:uncharacterized protein (UPF0335 family)